MWDDPRHLLELATLALVDVLVIAGKYVVITLSVKIRNLREHNNTSLSTRYSATATASAGFIASH